MKYWVTRLERMATWFFSTGRLIGMGEDRAIEMIGLLLSDMSDQKKIQLLIDKGYLSSPEDSRTRIVTEFEASPQLMERFERMKERRATEPVQLAAAMEVDRQVDRVAMNMDGVTQEEKRTAAGARLDETPAAPESIPGRHVDPQPPTVSGGLQSRTGVLWAAGILGAVAAVSVILLVRRLAVGRR